MFNTKMCDLYSKQMEYCERKIHFIQISPQENIWKCLTVIANVYVNQFISMLAFLQSILLM